MQLILTAISPRATDIAEELSRAVRDSRCAIVETRLSELANAMTAYMLVEGNWNHIARLENALEALAERLEWKVQALRLDEQNTTAEPAEMIPYTVDIYAAEQAGIFYEVISFFALRGIQVHDASASRYPAPYSESSLFTAHLIIKVPADIRPISLRDEFLDFCDHAGLDAIMEPIKR